VTVAAHDVRNFDVFVNSVDERYIFYIGVGDQAIGIVKIIAK
jgi:hypothetical protein